MALISEFREAPLANPAWRTETVCGYRSAVVEGEPILHLETYGSAERAVPGKGSQFIQIDRARAEELIGLLRQALPGR